MLQEGNKNKKIKTKMDLIKIVEESFATAKEFPAFQPGDTITVDYRIKEGNKERIQQYKGVVIRISGEGNKKRFTVRKMSDNVFSLSNRRLSTTSLSTSMVEYVVLSCTTSVVSQARRHASRNVV